MKMQSLHDIYVDQLKDVYSAEKQMLEALPKMAEAASNSDLKQAFEKHLQKTKRHMDAVRSILDEIDENPGNKKCKGMEGLLEEGRELAGADAEANAKDAALILAAQKVEHYEIATYGGLRTYANALGYSEVADRLQGILDDEYDADQELDNLAMGGALSEGLNVRAKD
jgi:ferritin-like metal-binding protein YciE